MEAGSQLTNKIKKVMMIINQKISKLNVLIEWKKKLMLSFSPEKTIKC